MTGSVVVQQQDRGEGGQPRSHGFRQSHMGRTFVAWGMHCALPVVRALTNVSACSARHYHYNCECIDPSLPAWQRSHPPAVPQSWRCVRDRLWGCCAGGPAGPLHRSRCCWRQSTWSRQGSGLATVAAPPPPPRSWWSTPWAGRRCAWAPAPVMLHCACVQCMCAVQSTDQRRDLFQRERRKPSRAQYQAFGRLKKQPSTHTGPHTPSLADPRIVGGCREVRTAQRPRTWCPACPKASA